ncbi:MAG TPA: molybdenum cofactor biosynthesis protein MoaE [Acidimicrobiales bacterium]|nr:molybdenum cofactor biosynthesis protein MoaE [Acidimicrobiales bacterium]
MSSAPTSDWISITENPLSPDDLSNWVVRPNCGGVVTFSGIVRNHSSARENVIALEYDTDAELAQQRLRDVVDEARKRWPALERVAIQHRIGRVELSESTVVVAVSAPHRDVAFEAARFCIDALKASVPMWKRELWEGGSAWSDETSPIGNARDQ